MKHVGNFTRGGSYGAEFELGDGTRANVVTVWGSPGLACDMEVEAGRRLTIDELESLMDADSAIDGKGARLDDPLLEAPALRPGVLEVEVGEIDLVRVNGSQNARKVGVVEPGGLKQQASCLGHQRAGGAGYRQVGHGIQKGALA